MTELPSNSRNKNTPKESRPENEEKETEKPVIVGKVVVPEKGFGGKLKEAFVGEDAKAVATYVLTDVFVPAIRDLMVDAVEKGMRRMVYGVNAPSRQSGGSVPASSRVTSYSSYSRQAARPTTQHQPRTRATREESNRFLFDEREDGVVVLHRMNDIISLYGVATVADLKELMGMASTHTDNRWGWDYELMSKMRHTRDGYLLELPSADPVHP